jgi:hypothetical protein
MTIMPRPHLLATCLALLAAAACSSPTSPSLSYTTPGATIGGVVNAGSGANASAAASSSRSTSSTSAGLTVSVEGTGLSATVDAWGNFQIAGVPSGEVRLRFSGGTVDATIVVSSVGDGELIEIQVVVSGGTATVVSEVRSGAKVSLCHRTDSGGYHLLDVSVNAEPAHRAHGDGQVGDPVPGTLTKVFDAACRPVGDGVSIVKATNGADANAAPGPSIAVGDPVVWTYVVTNTGTAALSNVTVVDDKGVVVDCQSQTTLAVGASMTCTGAGIAVLGQYSNMGKVTASSTAGVVTDSDPSHYLGVTPAPEEGVGEKVKLCHRTGAGFYVLIEVGVSAVPAHRAHGDGAPGEAVPGNAGRVFSAGCAIGG